MTFEKQIISILLHYSSKIDRKDRETNEKERKIREREREREKM